MYGCGRAGGFMLLLVSSLLVLLVTTFVIVAIFDVVPVIVSVVDTRSGWQLEL